MTPRISPHTQSPQSPHTTLDHLAALTQSRITRDRLRIPCPAHGGTNPNLELKVAGNRISAVCFSQGCSYRDIAQATLAKFGISIGRGHNEENTLTRTERRPASPKPVHHDLRTYALKLWRLSIPIPKSSEHPARQWLANRNLWRPELPLPGPVRWISAEHLHHDYPGAGAIITMAAQPTSWTQAWPNLPELSCIHLVFVAGDGSPAMDRGLNQEDLRCSSGRRGGAGMPAPGADDSAGGRRRRAGRRPGPGLQKPRSCRRNPGHRPA